MAVIYRMPNQMPATPGFLQSRNYPGSSGYGSPVIPSTASNIQYDDFPELGRNGLTIWHKTQKPVTGNIGGQQFKGGRQVNAQGRTPEEQSAWEAQIQNDPSQRYKAVDVVKSPAVAAGTDALMDEFRKNADSAIGDFSSHLGTFKEMTADAIKKGQAATDTTGFENATRGYNDRYSAELTGATDRYGASLAADAAAQQDIIRRANEGLPQYDAAAQAVADRQLAAVRQQVSRYKLASGTPTSLGSNELRILARGTQDVQLPVELAKIGRRYDILNNLEMPSVRNIADREAAFSGSFLPGVAGQRYTAGTGTESAIQNLRLSVAGMSFDNAQRYLQSINVPWQIQQQILSGQISNLAGLGQLEEGSRYRGLQDILGVNVSQPASYSVGTPAPPVYNPTVPRYFSGNQGDTRTVTNLSQEQLNPMPYGQVPIDPRTNPGFGYPHYAAPIVPFDSAAPRDRYGNIDYTEATGG